MGKGKIRGLYAIIDTSYVELEAMEKTAREILAGGASFVQLRAKGFGSGDFLTAAKLVREATAKAGAAFIVNDRVDIALLAGADGVHLGHEDLPVEEARRLLGPGKLIGLSTHNPEEAFAANSLARSGCVDYISFGPVFETVSKTDARTPKGLKGLSEVRSRVDLPITAIGGITEDNVESVIRHGADSAAMISSILTSTDVRKKVASVITRIEAAMQP